MTFTKRQKTMIMELIKRDEYITSRQLSLAAGVSVRTIKSEVKQINELLRVYGICIESKTGLGYRVNTLDGKQMPDVNRFLEDLNYDNMVILSNSMEGRIRYIASRLLNGETYIKSEVLADELFISTSTLSSDVKQLKYIVGMYGLKINSKPYKGLYISGKEKNIRNCIDFLSYKSLRQKENMAKQVDDHALTMIQQVYQTLVKITEKYNLQYPYYSLKDIAVQVYIQMERMKQGFVLSKDEEYQSDEIVKKIVAELEEFITETFEMSLPNSERSRLECLIDTLYIVDDHADSYFEYKVILDEVFKEISVLFNYNFNQDFDLTQSLLFHIRQLIKRCTNDVMIYNPLADHVLRDYLLSVDFANVLARKLKEKYHVSISIDEFSYLVIYFNVTIYSSSRMKEKSLYIYCPSSRAEEQMIREEVKRLFHEIVKHIEVVTKEQLEHKCYSGLDIIITSDELPSVVPAYIPVVKADMNHKMEFISNILIQLNEQVEGSFNMDELLSEEMFCVGASIGAQDEYFEFLFDDLCERMIMDYGEAHYLYEQAEKYGQEVGSHIVFIRSQNRFVLPFIHITFLNEMFFWNHDYVKLIIFVNFGDSTVEFRDFVYRKFKKLFSDKERLDKIFKKKDFDTFMKVLNQP